jgi:hypothetical protein
MARVTDDPEQQTHFGALIDEPDADVPPEERLDARTVVIGGETVRRGDKKPESRANGGRGGEGGLESPMRASPEPAEDEGVTELRRQLSNQQQTTARLQQIAQAEHNARLQAERGLNQTNVSMVDQAIESAKRDSEQARQYFQGALDRGDHKGASEAQIMISDARANLLRLMEMREGVAQEQPRQQPQPRQEYTPPPPDAGAQVQMNVQNLSAHLDRTGYPKSAEWIRSHPEMVRDRAAINKVQGVHEYVEKTLGLIPETEAYFDKLEDLLGVGEQREMPMNTRQGQRIAQQRSMGAPARSEAPSYRTGQVRGQRVALTSRQREHARDVLGMSDEEYAAELLDAQGRGKMLGARS